MAHPCSNYYINCTPYEERNFYASVQHSLVQLDSIGIQWPGVGTDDGGRNSTPGSQPPPGHKATHSCSELQQADPLLNERSRPGADTHKWFFSRVARLGEHVIVSFLILSHSAF